MTTRPIKPVLAVALSLGLALPGLPASAQTPVPLPDADKPGDGVVSPAACAAFGFTLPSASPTRQGSRNSGPVMAPPPPLSPPPPPPVR